MIFYSNGYQHWLWDDASYPPRAVQGFFKKQELELMIQRRQSRKSLADAKINEDIIGCYYQTRAVSRICETFEKDDQRKALVVMATGTGKTRTVIALSDLLMQSNWAKRVLFLADRVALVNQGVNAFKKHLADSSPVNLVTDKRNSLEKSQTALTKLNRELTGAEKAFVLADIDHKQVADQANRIEMQWFNNRAAELAAKLEIGQPCLVCGSTAHPNPAKFVNDSADITKATVDEARENEAELLTLKNETDKKLAC